MIVCVFRSFIFHVLFCLSPLTTLLTCATAGLAVAKQAPFQPLPSRPFFRPPKLQSDILLTFFLPADSLAQSYPLLHRPTPGLHLRHSLQRLDVPRHGQLLGRQNRLPRQRCLRASPQRRTLPGFLLGVRHDFHSRQHHHRLLCKRAQLGQRLPSHHRNLDLFYCCRRRQLHRWCC